MTSGPVRRLRELYHSPAAAQLYDEAVTELAHALQCAALAEADGADGPLVVAALLHDVGHLLTDREDDRAHEREGAAFLEPWFPAEVTEPVALHVAAKRYLVATDAAYAARLSPASVSSLVGQGGPMSRAEQRAFEADEHAAAAVRLRRWDDDAKVAGRATPGFGDLEPLIGRVAQVAP